MGVSEKVWVQLAVCVGVAVRLGVAVLVEVAFISNPKEEEKLKDAAFQAKVADAITLGVRRYLLEASGGVRRRMVGGPG